MNDRRSFINWMAEGWDRFWFTPAEAHTLAIVRIAIGLLLAYAHFVWAIGTEAFFGPHSWLDASAVAAVQDHWAAWSPLWLIDESPTLIGLVHAVATINAICLALGLFTQASSLLAFVLVTAYVHRNPAALYGFDQVLGFISLYLIVGRAGACYSLDRFLSVDADLPPAKSIRTNISTRLIQLHLCVVYLFSGVSKLKGATWWNGSAFWGAIANQEYQTIDITWLADWPIIINVLTHITIVWEVSYCAVVWHTRTRSIALGLAVAVHLGIASCFGMMTFGLSMLVANSAFLPSQLVRESLSRVHQALAEWFANRALVSARN